ncbi:MAG TPA: hypothetical protein ENH01_08605 [Nitrospirae bacterium]|nr:hypothetical protein [Nitrospirota bacterium]
MKVIDLIPEKEIREAVLSDYERRLVLYKLTDERLKKKYGISFKEFEDKNIVKGKDYSWEVEQDAMNWEHAVEGIKYLEEKIKKLREMSSES